MTQKLRKRLAAGISWYTAASLLTFATAHPADLPGRTIVAVDVSGSSTYIVDQSSADAAAAYISRYIAGLEQPHDLRMISVGDVGMANRSIDVRATVTSHRTSSARRLAAQFSGYFSSLPTLQLAEDKTTSLVEFFQSLEGVCASAPTQVIVFTDGIEWSAAVDGRAFIAGKATLPQPKRSFLGGCGIEMHGVGNLRKGAASDSLQHVAPQWRSFLEAAGADAVKVTGAFFDF